MVVPSLVKTVYGLSVVKGRRRAGSSTFVVGVMLPVDRAGV